MTLICTRTEYWRKFVSTSRASCSLLNYGTFDTNTVVLPTFLRLKSEKEDVRKKCYADCRMLREKLYEAEVLAAGKDIFFQAFVRDLQWAGEVFNRECLVTLEEC